MFRIIASWKGWISALKAFRSDRRVGQMKSFRPGKGQNHGTDIDPATMKPEREADMRETDALVLDAATHGPTEPMGSSFPSQFVTKPATGPATSLLNPTMEITGDLIREAGLCLIELGFSAKYDERKSVLARPMASAAVRHSKA